MRYDINPVLSRFTLKVHATGMLSAFGHSPTIIARDISGQITMPDGSSDAASLELSIKAASLVVADDVKESDRREIERTMYNDVLEVANYPEITFLSTEVSGVSPGTTSFPARIVGTLTVHGVSHPQEIVAQVNIMGDRLTANGKCTISQKAHGIKPVSIAGGTLRLKDEIDLTFDIVARAPQGS